jgi:hypothetical protein
MGVQPLGFPLDAQWGLGGVPALPLVGGLVAADPRPCPAAECLTARQGEQS